MTQPSPPPLDAAGQVRLRTLSEELRCLVCQNQTLADSHADLAIDLRNQVQELIAAGKTNDEIKKYLVERYGDFVLYRPPVQNNTALLWGGPFALLAGGGLIWAIVQRRSRLAARRGDKASSAQAGTQNPTQTQARATAASPPASAVAREAAGGAGGREAPSGHAAARGVPADMEASSRGVPGTAVAGSIVAGSAVPGAAWTPKATGMSPSARPPGEGSGSTRLDRARRLLDD